jgi:mono/diheme cytochrome c family protein
VNLKTSILVLTLLLGSVAVIGASETYAAPSKTANPPRVTLQSVYQTKCAKCHVLDKPDKVVKTLKEWQAAIASMRDKDPLWFTADEGDRIATFLAGRTLFTAKCAKCHALDRSTVKKAAPQWEAAVERMRTKDSTWISEAERKLIVFYLTDVNLLEAQ